MIKKVDGKFVWFKEIADTIVAHKILDHDKDETGSIDLDEMIACAMLKGQPEAVRGNQHLLFVRGVKNNREAALQYIETELGFPVYRIRRIMFDDKTSESHMGRVCCITIDPDYNEAKKLDLLRIKLILERNIESCHRQIKLKSPRSNFPGIVSGAMHRLGFTEQKQIN